VAGVIHYFWLVKSDVRKPAAYGAIVALLLGYRLAARLSGGRTRAAAGSAPPHALETAEGE
jgi:sulfoxide reductase heme-binding subunit YedZ